MKRTTGDMYTNAVLLQGYFEIQKNPSRRVVIVRELVNTLKQSGIHFYNDMIDINQKLGKMEYLMTQGERGTPGVPLPAMREIVKIYETDKALFELYLEAFYKNTTVEKLQAKAAAKEKVISGYEENAAIDMIPFPTRILRILEDNNIHTISDFASCSAEDFAHMAHVGEKSLEDILEVFDVLKKHIQKKKEEEEKQAALQKEAFENKLKALLAQGVKRSDNVLSLPVSGRTRNRLCQQNVRYFQQLQNLPFDSWEKVKNCGPKTLEEIQLLYKLLELLPEEETEEHPIIDGIAKGKDENKIKDLLAQGVRKSTDILSIPVSGRTKNALRGQKVECLEQLQDIPVSSWEKVKNCGAKTLEEIQLLYGLLELLLEETENKEETTAEIIPEATHCPTLMEFVNGIDKENYKIALLGKLHGDTLEEIGKRIHVTRERVRQMIKKVFDNRPVLQEDDQLPIWDTYRALSDEDYQFIFDIQPETLQYFRFISKSHKEKENQVRFDCLRQIIHDYADNETIVSRAKELLKKSRVFVLIDGERIEKNRPALIRYAVRTYCQNELSLEEFLAKYNELLKSLSLNTDSKYMVQNNNGIATRLANASCVLWGQWKKLRYYDISAIDSKVFIAEIGLLNCKDVEISAQKFLNDYPDVMKEYDIRNAYEMHNLLKKIWDMDHLNRYLDEHHQVVFGRMPMISIGHANRKRQVMELIQNHSPIKVHDLANLYEEFYGVNTLTVSSNFLTDFDQYLNQDTYSIHWTPLPDAVRYQMKKVLTADFYFLEEVYDIFKQEFPNENVWLLNPFTLKEIGFLSYTNYIVRNTYNSAVDYFRHILRQPEADLRDRAYLLTINTFYSQVMKARSEFKIVEVEPLVYNNMEYLQEKGITKDQFYEFWHFIENHVADNEFFTVFSLKKAGLSLPWQKQYFRNWFYSSVLLEDKENFRYQRYGECRLFRKSKEMFNLKDFLRFVVSRLDKEMEFHEFTRYLQENYGFCPQESRLKEAIEAEYDLSEKIAIY